MHCLFDPYVLFDIMSSTCVGPSVLDLQILFFYLSVIIMGGAAVSTYIQYGMCDSDTAMLSSS